MKRLYTSLLGVLGLTVVAGCGFNAEQQIADALAASAQSLFDQWLTDVAYAGADARDAQSADDADDEPADDQPDDDPDPVPADDAVARGGALVENSCSACHGADGASGFAPNIQGADAATIGAFVGGGNGHTVVDLAEEEIADVASYLATFADDAGAGDGGSGLTGDAVAGETLVDDNCALCHGADGASGFAPNIQGVSEAAIAEKPGSGGDDHLLIELTEQQIADIAAYLDSL